MLWHVPKIKAHNCMPVHTLKAHLHLVCERAALPGQLLLLGAHKVHGLHARSLLLRGEKRSRYLR